MSLYGSELDRKMKGLQGTGSDLNRKFWVALALYGVLGLLVWFTMDVGKVLVHGRPVELRLIPLIVIGGLALRTVVAHQAERIRRQDASPDGKGSSR
jgi:O-antigen ligase